MAQRKKNSKVIPRIGSILIVDDEEVVHTTLKRLLKDEGFTMDSAYSTKEALSKIGAGYDLVICDIRMPDMDGIEMLRQIKKRQVDAEVIMLTGYASFESAVKALNFGALDYLMKPIEDVSEFKSKVYKAIKKAQLTRRNKEFYDSIVSGKLPAYQTEIKEIIKYIMELLHVGIVFLNADGIITFHNVCFTQMLGGESHDSLGMWFESYIAEEDRGKIHDVLKRLAEGEIGACVYTILNHGKHQPVVIDFMSVYADEKFNVVITIKDIEDIKIAEEKAEIITNLVEKVRYDIILVVQPDGRITQYNVLLRNPFSYTHEEMLSLNIKDLLKNGQNWESIINSVRQNKYWDGELLAVDKTGSNFPVEVGMSIIDKESVLFFMQDISERKRAVEALWESEERFRGISASAQDGIVMMDNEGNISYWNDAAERIFGYIKEEVIGKEAHVLLMPERYHEAYGKGFRSFRETGQGPVVGKIVEVSAIRKDGTEFPIELSVSAIKIKGIWNSIGILRDITERKKAEEDLRQSEQKFKDLIETTTDWVWEVDAQGVYIYASPKVKDLLGYEPAEVIGKMLFDLMPEEGTEKIRNIFKQTVINKEPFSGLENVNLHKDGHLVVLETNGIPIFDQKGELKGYRGIDRDITKRKKAEQDMAIRNRVAEIFLTTPDEQIYGEVLQVILEAMESKYGVFGYIDAHDTLIIPSMTRDIWELCRMPDKTIEFPREKWGGIWGRSLREKRSLYANEGLHVPAGHVPVTKVLVVPIIYGERAIGLLEVANKAMGYDEKDREFMETIANHISPILNARLQRDRKERELRDAEEELLKAYQELKGTYIQLVQAGKLTAMGEMAAGVAHELTQPLFGIKGFTTALLEDMKRNLPTETSQQAIADIDVILQQTDRMMKILNMIREFARASGTEILHLDINKPIEDALLLFSEQLRLHNIVVEKNLSRDLPPVMGNANQLQQVFINLIINSRDAIDAKGGGGRLEIKTGTSPADASILIEVVDNGIGADAETMSKMFDPFFTTKRAGSGCGLGLSIVDRIIKEHRGTINVWSEPGRGCKFSIRLPLDSK